MLGSLNLSLRTKQFLIALAIIAVWLCINSAFASGKDSVEIAPTATINSLIENFTSKLEGIQSIFRNGARNLFLSLAVIEIGRAHV